MRSLAARIADTWRGWRERRRWIGELADAAAFGRLEDVLYDVSLTRAELDLLVKSPADAGRQFERLAEMAQIDLAGLDPVVLREANWVCIRCDCAEACKRWLRTGVWHGGDNTRCPNAALFRH